MKKLMVVLMILTVIMLLTSSLVAQGMGIKGGMNLAKFIGSDSDLFDLHPKFAMGFTVGGFFTFDINEQMSIRPEFLYLVKGSKYEEKEDGETATLTYAMNYIDIPILGVFSVHEKINIFAGPYVGIFLNGTMKMEYDGDSEEEDIEKENIANDFGLIFGGAYGIGNNLSIEARYTLGLKTLDKEPDDWDSEDGDYDTSDIKNSAFQIMLNYSF